MEGVGEGSSSLLYWLARSVAWAVAWFEQDGAVYHGLIDRVAAVLVHVIHGTESPRTLRPWTLPALTEVVMSAAVPEDVPSQVSRSECFAIPKTPHAER